MASRKRTCGWSGARDDPTRSARQVIIDFNERIKTEAHARLIGAGHEILDAAAYGFSSRDRAELTRLLALPKHVLGACRIDEMFSGHFFETNFWQMWRTTFAFQNWHSAIELRRYFVRFVQEFPRLHTLFLGQFTDLPEDVVFTVEYSVHGAMRAVYGLFGVAKEIPPIYHGLLDPKVGLKALESAFR